MGRYRICADPQRLAPGVIFGFLKGQRHLRVPAGLGERGAAQIGVDIAGLVFVAHTSRERARLLDGDRAVDRYAPQHDAVVGADLGEPGEVDDALGLAGEVVGRLAQHPAPALTADMAGANHPPNYNALKRTDIFLTLTASLRRRSKR